MKLSAKAQAALDRVVARFQAGDLGPLVAVARLRLSGDAPAVRWSLSNRVLAYLQTGSLDCRGYRQWQRVGRQVRKGARAAYILAPRTRKVTNETTGQEDQEERVMCGFLGVAVFPYEATVGDECATVAYEPAAPPPLLDVAQALGIAVAWAPLAGALGHCAADGQDLVVGSHDPAPFFHELAHAVHARLAGRLKVGQHADQEAVSELTAAVLMELYGYGDRSGNAWQYIAGYHPDPLVAITRAIGAVEEVLAACTCVLGTGAGQRGDRMR